MKVLAKITLALLVGGVSATMYAAPGDSTNVDVLNRAMGFQVVATSALEHVQSLQEVAHKQRDIIMLNCVNDKLLLLKTELNILDRSMLDVRGAEDASAQQAALAAMSQASDSARQLGEASEQCVGRPTLSSESSNSFDHPDMISPPQDPTFGMGGIEPPAYASPFN